MIVGCTGNGAGEGAVGARVGGAGGVAGIAQPWRPRSNRTAKSPRFTLQTLHPSCGHDLGEKPDGAKSRDLRDKALGYINEAVLWKDARPRPSVPMREALMKKVLALHVEVNKLGGGGTGDEGWRARGPSLIELPAH